MFSERARVCWVMICILSAGVCSALDYDASDFAVEIVEYIQGGDVGSDWLSGDPYNDPNTALGRPTLETTGDGWFVPVEQSVPVVPLYSAFRAFEIVTIGNGGHLTLKFDHKISDDKNNPYGIDFIVFGQAAQPGQGGQFWTNGNPEDITVDGLIFSEPGIVAVSQDGINWYYFSDGPFADDFAPTASYQWDRIADQWSQELDPRWPVDPNLTASDMQNLTMADMIDMYEGSAGGTGFDLKWLDPNDYAALAVDPKTGKKWIKYVMIEDDPASTATTEIDAVSDVSCCGDYKHPYPVGDFNQDCIVDMTDLAVFMSHWLDNTWNRL